MPAPAPPAPPADPPIEFDSLNPPAPKAIQPEDDPNLKMQELISRRATRRAAKEEPKENKTLTDDERAALEVSYGVKDEDKKASDSATARFLGSFRQKPPAKKPDEAKADEKTTEQKTQEEERQKDDPQPKTIVSKKQPASVLDQTARIVSEATTAATREAMKGLREQQQQKPAAAPQPEELLTARDRHEYEVAQYMAQTNPKFRNAPQVLLDQIKKANAHAARWEAQNQGKVYNPDDEEHAEFHDALDAERPWSQEEFDDAKVDRRAEIIADKKNQKLNTELEELRREQARNSLREDVQNAHTIVAGALAKAVGEDVFETITKEGFGKLAEKDPITHEVISSVLGSVQPLTEALVELEDPKMRVKFDPNNQAHIAYATFFYEVEARFSGQRDDAGKLFATRADYQKMSPSEQARSWCLTTQMLGAELVGDASKVMTERIQTEKDRLKKYAESQGYVPRAQAGQNGNKPVASNRPPPPPPSNGTPTPPKPASPAASSGVAIDNTETAPSDPLARFMKRNAEVLFRGSSH